MKESLGPLHGVCILDMKPPVFFRRHPSQPVCPFRQFGSREVHLFFTQNWYTAVVSSHTTLLGSTERKQSAGRPGGSSG